ncbi:unnamed protein product, partial [Allacma fusca]
MKQQVLLEISLLLALSNIFTPIQTAKIFFMIPLTTKSEKQPWFPLIDALGKRGHEITVASIVKSNYTSPNVKEFISTDYESFLGDEFSNPIEVRKNSGRYFSLVMDYDYAFKACHKVYANPEFQKAINQEYDLIFFNFFFQDCFLGILHKKQTPFIIFSSMLPYHYLWELAGSTLSPSFVPFALGPPRPLGKLSFRDRLENFLLDLHLKLMTHFSYLPDAEKIYRTYVGENSPSAYDIHKNFTLIFSNTHYTYNAPTPTMPDIIEVGGMHCRPANPLPKELDDFLSAFSKMKQRVIWKFEGDLKNLPANVKISKWLPQQDILGHPNIKLFMTHGGAMSTYEAVYHGVPLLTLPVFCDQNINSNLAVERGMGLEVEILDLTENIISTALEEILTNPKYEHKAKELSSVFRDQPQTPIERGVFWA